MPNVKKTRVSKDQWLGKGLEILSAYGAESLRVEKLATSLGVAKSGFYWHFRDREEFLTQLLDYWAHEYTQVISDNSMLTKLPPRHRLLEVMMLVFEKNLTEHDDAMQLWVKTNARTARKYKKVVGMRLDFVRKAFEELGFTGDELEMRTRVFVGFQSNERGIFGANKASSRRYRQLRLDMLVGGKPDKGPKER
ncbi:MAG: TetR/AcrR family transcriptional regulator [Halioglobus sp.]